LTYGSAGPDLDAAKFIEYRDANLEVDECYTTTDRALKYTLIHLERRNRQTALRGFMDYVSLKYGIVPNEIFGYSVIGGNNAVNELYEFPGFRVLHQHMVEANPSFTFWIKSPDLRRGGILRRYIGLHTSGSEEAEIEDGGKVVVYFINRRFAFNLQSLRLIECSG
jgi:hypothetical protein